MTPRGTAALEPRPEPTLDDVRREYEPSPVNQEEEVTELVGLCLWDVFSDNHDVIAADGRVADIGSFRGAGAFLDEYLTRDQEGWSDGDYMRFYMGTIWISRRSDLMPVYAMIFRRLKAAGADWVYHFPEIGIVELAPADDADKPGDRYSVSQAAVGELEARIVVPRSSGSGPNCARRMRVRARRRWTAHHLRRCALTGRCTGVIHAAGVRRENRRALCRSFAHVRQFRTPYASNWHRSDAPTIDCAEAMSRVKAALAGSALRGLDPRQALPELALIGASAKARRTPSPGPAATFQG